LLQPDGPPAIVLPLARAGATPERTATELPVAVQLVARHGDEATLFRLAAQLEKAWPWFDRKPPVAM
jgi:Asp-tRNA(Asn)/Glu-tRNA(Gln) amidotransferase A subunit family amidase